jgi:hypothetical protein
LAKEVVDAFAAYRGGVVHSSGTGVAGQEGATVSVGEAVAFPLAYREKAATRHHPHLAHRA